MSGKLMFVATPIGNMNDITKRAIDTLNSVDEILCEDTRHSAKLLNLLNIKKPLKSYHKFNYNEVMPSIISELKAGKNFALITDAGTPAISDPGSEIIAELVKEDIYYTIIPGATASVNAYAVSGFKGGFSFIGFLPEKNKDKELLIKDLKSYKTALLFFSAPHNLNADLDFLYKFLGNRKVVIVRELTKMYEEIYHTTLEKGYNKTPRGEFVLVIEGKTIKEENALNNLTVEEHLEYYAKLDYKKNDAIKQVAKDRGVSRQEIYNIAIKK
ncbi:MAG: 16S rRNA (cytidine(1402)-2'-O)-methyltransferase [Clostridia bacterium]|nr:16S rRNA (cytidine(1402)-2'-O)-methyltransferase [Clostridia bacterium]